MPDPSKSRQGPQESPFILIIFIFLSLYWVYLAFVTQPVLVYDAKGYEDLGTMITQKGWVGYFTTGPNREPVYPFLIATAMRWAHGGPYQAILKIVQVFSLLLTEILAFLLLKRANVSRTITALALFYIGISPALVNSALSVYSEIVTYPFILGIILAGSAGWDAVQKGRDKAALALGIALGGLFVAITLIKGIYEIIVPLFLIPYAVLAVKAWMAKNKHVFKRAVILLTASVLVFQFCIVGYKSLNKKYNGLFSLTDRGAWALYGNTARRQEPLTVKKFFAGIAYNVLERDGCDALFGPEACVFWDLPTSDRLAVEKNYETMREFPPDKHDSHLLQLSFEKIIHNPFQYVLLTGFDWVHMFFWESTRIGFVAYPDWMDKIFDCPLFQKSLRLGVGFLSLGSTLFVACSMAKRKGRGNRGAPVDPTIFLTIYMIFWHVTLYSMFSTLPRYALPIAPLYLLIIAFAGQGILKEKEKRL